MRLALLACLWVVTAVPASAREPWHAVIDLHLGGLRAGEIEVSVAWDGSRYEAQSNLRARGLAALLLSGGATAAASGAADGQAVAPSRFDAEGRFGRSAQVIRMAYVDGAPVIAVAEPALRQRSYDAPRAALSGALDPLSAVVAALTPRPVAQACDSVVSVFDSRRRFDLRLGKPTATADGLRCEGAMVRVAGFKNTDREPAPFSLEWRVDGGMAYPLRAVAPTAFGAAVARIKP